MSETASRLRDVSVERDVTLRVVAELMRANDLHQIPVVDAEGRYLGLIDEGQILRASRG